MKVIIFALAASLALAGVVGANTYGEKEDAIKEIDDKYTTVFRFAHSVIYNIVKEMNRTETHDEKEAIKHGEKLQTETLNQFADEVKKVSRTAVAKGKPPSTFVCLAEIALDGRTKILELNNHYQEEVKDVLPQRRERLYNLQVAAALILNAVTELKDQAVQDIENSKIGIQSKKNEALKKIDTGNKQVSALRELINKPTLFEEYENLKKQMNVDFKDLKEELYRKLQKCFF